MMSWLLANSWPLSFLVSAIADDLVYRKFHNALFMVLLASGLFYTATLSPLSWTNACGGLLVGGGLLLPLVLGGALGAGDMKFMMAFGMLAGTTATISIVIFAVVWGAVLGLTKAFVSGQWPLLLSNVASLATLQRPTKLVRVPFTVAIMLGWLSYQWGGLL